MYARCLLLAGIAALGAACSDPTPGDRTGLSSSPVEQADLSLVASLSVGSGPGEVTLRPPADEAVAGGPSALAVDSHGTIYLADTLGHRIVRVRPGGAALPPLRAPAVEDVAIDGHGLVYAFNRRDLRVAIMDRGGQTIETIEIPRTLRWVTGLCVLPDGEIGLFTAYQESVPLRAQALQRGLAEGVPGLDGGRYRTVRRDGAARIERVRRGDDRTVVERRLEVPVATALGSLSFLGASRDGELVVDVQDVVDDDPITVERAVRRYSPSGLLVAERPVPRGIYAPPHALELSPDGAVYVLRPTLDGVEVWAWPAGGER